MTEDTTGHAGESNPLDGVSFIEERIISVPKAPRAQTPAPSAQPVIPVSQSAPAPTPPTSPAPAPRPEPSKQTFQAPPREMPEIAPLMRDIPPPPKPAAPPPQPSAPVSPTVQPPTSTRVPLTPSAPPIQEPVREPAPILEPSPAPQIKSEEPMFAPRMQEDMQKILADVKLPERRVDAPPRKEIPIAPTQEEKAPTPAPLPETAPLAEKIAAEAPAPAAPDTTNERTLASVHTLKDDLQHVVRDNKISYVRAVALEEEKRSKKEVQTEEMPKHASTGMRVVILSISLIGLGALALGAVFFIQSQRVASPNTIGSTSVMFAEQTVTFPLGNVPAAEVKRALADARVRVTSPLGSMIRIVPTLSEGDIDAGTLSEREATFKEFFEHLGARPPEEFWRAVSNEFFFGIHTVDENAPLIVVPVTSYENAFAAMLSWEKVMNSELAPVFTQLSALTIDQTGLPVERSFTDKLLRNYDVRTLVDDSGTTQLFYAFPTRDILIIGESEYSFTEVLSRLRAERKL